jgi:hypothetical protein
MFWDWDTLDERPRFAYRIYLNYILLWTSDLFRDLYVRFNTRARASILVLMHFFDSPIDRVFNIRATGDAGDWDHLLPIERPP